MKQLCILLPAALICVSFQQQGPADGPHLSNTGTGIVLDSLGNEIYISYLDGKPTGYYANIFTPVCNTGECLPVFVNFYWNLAGQYQSYDQPEGQILTKLDHVPFTEEDYRLLDEILRGPDPRYDDPSVQNPGHKQDHGEHTSPAPGIATKKFLTKYEMIDGITGATAIRHRAKFVPGALYTTYTLWGLANDSRDKMVHYTRQELLTHENFNYLISHYELGCQYLAVEQLLAGSNGENARTNRLMSVIDSTDEKVASILINHINYDDYDLDTVNNTIERKFFSSTDSQLQHRTLGHWTYNYVRNETMIRLAAEMHRYPEVFEGIIQLYAYRPYWPEGVLDHLLEQVIRHSGYQRERLVWLLDSKKDSFSQEDWEKIKAAYNAARN